MEVDQPRDAAPISPSVSIIALEILEMSALRPKRYREYTLEIQSTKIRTHSPIRRVLLCIIFIINSVTDIFTVQEHVHAIKEGTVHGGLRIVYNINFDTKQIHRSGNLSHVVLR